MYDVYYISHSIYYICDIIFYIVYIIHCLLYRRLGGESKPGNRFVSCVRARGVVVRWEWTQNVILFTFPFPFSPESLSLFPSGDMFPFPCDIFKYRFHLISNSFKCLQMISNGFKLFSVIPNNFTLCQVKSNDSKYIAMISNDFK